MKIWLLISPFEDLIIEDIELLRALELGMKIESGVGALLGEDLEFDLEVLEVGLVDLAAVEEVGTGPFDDDLSIIHLPRVGGFIDGPSVEALPVEQFVEAILVLGLVMIGKGCAGQRERECDCAEQFHRGVVIGGGGKLGNPNRPGSRPGWMMQTGEPCGEWGRESAGRSAQHDDRSCFCSGDGGSHDFIEPLRRRRPG